jgi:hypothetical protein
MRILLLITVLLTAITASGCSTSVSSSAEMQSFADSLGITIEELQNLSDEELQRLTIEAAASEGEA